MTSNVVGEAWVIATPRRRWTATLVSWVLPFAVALPIGIWLLTSRSPGAQIYVGVVIVLLAAGYAMQVVSRARHGRSLGNVVTRTRVAKRSSGTPPTIAQVLRTIPTWHRRERTPSRRAQGSAQRGAFTATATFDLVRGEDPRTLSLPPLRLPDEPSDEPSLPGRTVHPISARPVAELEALTLRFDTGDVFEIESVVFVGRNPTVPDGEKMATGLVVADLSRTISKTHARIAWDHDELWIEDLRSANGVALQSGEGPPVPITAGVAVRVPAGVVIWFGDRSASVLRPAPALT